MTVCSFAIHTLLLDRSDTPHRRHQKKTEINFRGQSLRDSPRRDGV
jgi:hypothetical protein